MNDDQYFLKIKDYLGELGVKIVKEVHDEHLVIVEDEQNGIKNLIIDCEDPILVIEQFLMPLPKNNDFYLRLLQLNRQLVHGAFVADETAEKLLWRDTLQLENLDLNELEGSIRALSLAMAETSHELLSFSQSK